MTETENRGFIYTCKDLLQKIDCCVKWCLPVLCMMVVVILFFTLQIDDGTARDYLETLSGVVSGILGFLIAASAIMYSLSENVVHRLGVETRDGKVPYDEIIGNMVFTSLVAVLTIALTLIALLVQGNAFRIFFCVSLSFTLYVLILCIHILLHLFATRTFINPK